MANHPLSFMQEPTEISPDPTGSAGPRPEDSVAALLEGMDFGAPEGPPEISTGKRILGGIADALHAFGTVKAGGAPPGVGPFLGNLQETRRRFEQQQASAEAEKRGLTNRIKIAEFQEGRRIRAGERQEKVAREEKDRNRTLDADQRLRSALIQKALDNNLDFGDRTVAEISTDELREINSKHDPMEVLRLTVGAILDSAPEGMVMDTFRINKDGSPSITFKRSDGKDDPISPKALIDAAKSGMSGLSSLTSSKDLGKLLEGISSQAQSKQKNIAVGERYEQVLELALDRQFLQNPETGETDEDIINSSLVDSIPDLQNLLATNGGSRLAALYQSEVDLAIMAVADGNATAPEMQEYLSEFRELALMGFPDVKLAPVPSLSRPVVSVDDNKTEGGEDAREGPIGDRGQLFGNIPFFDRAKAPKDIRKPLDGKK